MLETKSKRKRVCPRMETFKVSREEESSVARKPRREDVKNYALIHIIQPPEKAKEATGNAVHA
jgi:hypothetical protein